MSEEMQPHYYMNIPAFVWDDKDLLEKPKAILLYGHISTLANKKGYCWATNEYFIKALKASRPSVIRYINLLVNKGYIKRKLIYEKGTKEIKQRILSIDTRSGVTDDTTPIITDDTRSGVTDDTDNNTRNNNTSINKSSSTAAESSQNAFELYQIVVGILTPMQSQNLSEYIRELSDDVVKFAINAMANQTEQRSFNYLNRILMKYEQLGINTVKKAEALEKEHQAKKKPKKKVVKRQNKPSEEWGGW